MKRARESCFVIKGHLGSGTYGQVYAVTDPKNADVPLALKLFSPIASILNDATKNFSDTVDWVREFFGASRAGLTRGVLITPDRIGIVMPCLGARIGNTAVPHYSIGQSAELLLPIVQSLAKTPGMHRDIKLANILLPKGPKEQSTLVDFSLATNIEKSNDDAVITIWYRPPEVLLNFEYDQRVDIWSLGIVLLNILTGTHLLRTPTEETKLQFCIDLLDMFGWPDETEWPQMYSELRLHYDSRLKQGNSRGHYNFKEMLSQGPGAKADRVDVACDLLSKMLKPCPAQRASWSEVLSHEFWTFTTTVHIFSPAKISPMKKNDSSLDSFFENAIYYNKENSEKIRDVESKFKLMAMDYFIYYGFQMNYELQTSFSAYLMWLKYVERGHQSTVETLSAALFLAASFNEDLRLTASNDRQTWKKWANLWDELRNPKCFQDVAIDMMINVKEWPNEKFSDVAYEITQQMGPMRPNKILFLATSESLTLDSLKSTCDLMLSLRQSKIVDFVSAVD
jgi:serine/threonine protein kinase